MEIQDVKYGVQSSCAGLKSENIAGSNRAFSSILQEKYRQSELKEEGGSENVFESITGQGKAIKSDYGILTRKTTAISIDDLIADCDDMIEAFQDQTMNLFSRYGVDTSQEIELECDEYGNVKVANDHPDKEKIEKIFQDNPELANLYRAISATQSIIYAFEESAGFREMYADNPKQAVQTYRYLFDDNRDVSDQFTIKIVDGRVVVA